MSVSGLDHYNLRASGELLETLRRFYLDAIGLQEGWRPPFRSRGHWLYAGERDVLHLTEAATDEPRTAGATSTFDHIAFTCTDPDAMEARLRRHGIDHTVDDVPATSQKQIFLRDPAGNGIELNFALGAQSAKPDGEPGA